MPGRKMLCLGVTFLLLAPSASRAQHGHMHGGGGGHHMGGGGNRLAGVGGYPGFFVLPYYGTFGPGGGVGYYPGLMMGPSGFGFAPFAPMLPPPMPARGPLLAAPPPNIAERWPRHEEKPRAPSDPKRATQLMTIGDRLFRAGNLKKAEERYQQAVRAAGDLAAPYVRLAQLSLVRGNYTVAANRLREAETVQPGWLETAPDIQSIYGEPAEFAHQISRLESHVQIHPDDRDAWLVLGAQWFLSGRTARAADVFLRLDDPKRKPDIALAAFLDASNQVKPPPEEEGNSLK
jgi:hypothetical protein